jgi:adenylate cyclase
LLDVVFADQHTLILGIFSYSEEFFLPNRLHDSGCGYDKAREQIPDMRRFSIQTFLKWVYNRFIPACMTILGLLGLWFVCQQAESQAFNYLSRWSARSAKDSQVVLVLIDDESIARLRNRFGPPPWSRQSYLEMFRAVQSAKPALMVFDSHFISLDPHEDARFFTELKRFPNLISGLVMEEAHDPENKLNTHVPQYYRLNLGVVSVSEDPDGFIRSVKPIYQARTGLAQTGIFPSLSLAAVFEYLNQLYPGSNWTANIDSSGGGRSMLHLYPEARNEQGVRLPLNEENAFYIRWYRISNQTGPEAAEYARSHQAVSIWRFLDKRQPLPSLSGKIALIGASSAFYRDYHQTPMSTRHLGPDIHATSIDNLLQGHAVRKAGGWLNTLILLLFCHLIFILRLWVRNFGKTVFYTLGTMVIYCWVAFWLLSEHSMWLDVVTPEMFIVVSFLAGSTFRIFSKEKQLEVMEKNLSQLVDPEVFQEIRRRSHILKPGGQKLEITSMFVDIRNFTALAERLQPAEVTELLNEFYGDIVNIVFSYHGTIDKFMGDGILIIFGAPLPHEDHRAMALLAAHDILGATERLSRHWQENKGIDTEIGISLNSGPAFVGFLGPADKLEYTGVGDTVNICVRLQEHTKQFYTRLIVSEQTVQGLAEQLGGKIPPDSYVELGEVSVRGREATIRIFTLRQAMVKKN